MPKDEFQVQHAAPVVRMLDESAARAFYLDYLGFEIEWESRFSPTAPLYAEIRLGDARLHLDGHAGEETPIARVVISVRGLQAYCDSLVAKSADYPTPSLVDPRYVGRNTDMNLSDPFGNELVFCCQQAES